MVVVYLLLVPLSDCCQCLAADDGGDPEEDPLLGLPEGGGDAVPQDPWDGQAEARTLAPCQRWSLGAPSFRPLQVPRGTSKDQYITVRTVQLQI